VALLVAAGADHLGAELARRLDRDDSRRDDAAILAQVLSWLLGGIGSAGPDLVAELVTASEKVLATGLRTVPTFVPSGTESPYGSPEPVPAFEAELRWTPELDRCHPGDIGVAMALLLNHVVLEPGQGLFLGAGNLHAYLRGAGVEIMANGDNVIRGGLTAKHVDGAELAAIVDTTPGSAPIQTARDGCHRFDAPTPDFSLTRLQGPSACRLDPQGPEIVLVTAGRAELTGSTGPAFTVGPGQAAVVAAADGPYRIDAGPGTVAWRAAVGDARALSASSCRV
jgi:mannose-6-phosphate isomerase